MEETFLVNLVKRSPIMSVANSSPSLLAPPFRLVAAWSARRCGLDDVWHTRLPVDSSKQQRLSNGPSILQALCAPLQCGI